MPKGSPTKKRKRERLDRPGQSGARHGERDAAVRSEKARRQRRDAGRSGRRGDTGG